ncbi:MAG TPA: amino acid ABC transporter substrate-binding protein [Burkholderiales bacterium]|nr:amino acid ABC transporter substrate-binding protein [Burkholderiales bacterium]
MSRGLLILALLAPLAVAHAGARLDKIKAAGKLTVAFADATPPFSFRDKDGLPDGYSIELCRAVVTGIQAQVGKKLDVKWVAATTPDRLKMVAQGKADLECGVTTRTLGREDKVGFSLTVFVDGAGVLVPKGSAIIALPGLDGQKIAVVSGTTTEQHLRDVLKDRGIAGVLVPVADRKTAFEMADRGEVQAYAGDRAVLIGQVLTTKTKTPDWTLLDAEISFEPYAFAMARGDPDLQLAADRALAAVFRSGRIADIYGRWFGRFGPPQPVMRALFLLNKIPE